MIAVLCHQGAVLETRIVVGETVHHPPTSTRVSLTSRFSPVNFRFPKLSAGRSSFKHLGSDWNKQDGGDQNNNLLKDFFKTIFQVTESD